MLRPFKLIKLMLIFLKDLWKSNFIIAWDIITPGTFEKQDFITIKLETQRDIHLFLLTSMITMTPGTLSVKINEEKTELIVHSLYNHDEKAVIAAIMANQRLIKEIF
jgi:multisubunit Na+/H+ antiporter MnhE subunit